MTIEKEGAKRDMVYGALWCVGGVIATIADFGYIFIGAIVFGGIQFLKGLYNNMVENLNEREDEKMYKNITNYTSESKSEIENEIENETKYRNITIGVVIILILGVILTMTFL